MSTETKTELTAGCEPSIVLCQARRIEEQSGLQFARQDVQAGQNGLASTRHFIQDDISLILGRAANDKIVTLSIVAPLR